MPAGSPYLRGTTLTLMLCRVQADLMPMGLPSHRYHAMWGGKGHQSHSCRLPADLQHLRRRISFCDDDTSGMGRGAAACHRVSRSTGMVAAISAPPQWSPGWQSRVVGHGVPMPLPTLHRCVGLRGEAGDHRSPRQETGGPPGRKQGDHRQWGEQRSEREDHELNRSKRAWERWGREKEED